MKTDAKPGASAPEGTDKLTEAKPHTLGEKFKAFLQSRRVDPRVAADLKSQRRPITIGLICSALASALYAATITLVQIATKTIEDIGAALKGPIVTRETSVHHSMSVLLWACLATVGIFGLRYWLMRGQLYYLAAASTRLAAQLRIKLFSKLLRLPVSYFNDRRSGAIQSVLNNDVTIYQTAISIIRDSIDGPIKAVAALVTILVIQPYLALLALMVVPVMLTVIQRNSRNMRAAQGKVQDDLADLAGTTNEVLQGTRVVKAFGVEKRTEEEYGRLIEVTYNSQMTASMQFAKLRPTVELIGAMALTAFLLGGGWLAAQGKLDASQIVAMAFAMDVINQGFRSYANLNNTLASVRAASDRIHAQVLDIPEEVSDRTPGTRTLPNPSGRIEFQNVTFQYPDGTEALKDVSFTIEPGTSLAIVGPSGAGKSTIADLILRFYEPTSGRVLLDGVDIRELDSAFLRSLIGVVPQHTFLFAGTIEDNIRIGRSDATEKEIREALEAAHATEFAHEMTGRATSELGERGIRLSGGQMQRVAIARALVRKPTVLLLDEATSALDASSEQAVTEALDEIMKQRTTLMIAHRLTTAARADRLLYLRGGKVIEEGSHTELIKKDGEYAALFRLFSGGVLDSGFVH